ncbi:hypothetical protein B5X24_HaOG205880 [Helicoverpa armigera]|nr:hypothetical protein B5X24_HaOG205880 [Helicoverpa armigera]
MKLFGMLVLMMAVLALLSGASASPKGIGGALRKGGKVIKHGLSAIGVVGTGHQIYQQSQQQ